MKDAIKKFQTIYCPYDLDELALALECVGHIFSVEKDETPILLYKIINNAMLDDDFKCSNWTEANPLNALKLLILKHKLEFLVEVAEEIKLAYGWKSIATIPFHVLPMGDSGLFWIDKAFFELLMEEFDKYETLSPKTKFIIKNARKV